MFAARFVYDTDHCRSCRRLRSFDLALEKQDQKIAASFHSTAPTESMWDRACSRRGPSKHQSSKACGSKYVSMIHPCSNRAALRTPLDFIRHIESLPLIKISSACPGKPPKKSLSADQPRGGRNLRHRASPPNCRHHSPALLPGAGQWVISTERPIVFNGTLLLRGQRLNAGNTGNHFNSKAQRPRPESRAGCGGCCRTTPDRPTQKPPHSPQQFVVDQPFEGLLLGAVQIIDAGDVVPRRRARVPGCGLRRSDTLDR